MSDAVRMLRRVARSGGRVAVSRCELCSEELPDEHGHVADVQEHRLLCACRACTLLFAPSGAGGGRFRVVSGEVRRLDGVRLDPETWLELGVPVDVVFFLRRTGGAVTACYPGPAGAVESEVDEQVWQRIVEENPLLDRAVPDVEAVLARRTGPDHAAQACYLLPVDRCYELVGLVRSWWSGPSGGAEVWPRLAEWFDELDRESVTSPAGELR